MNMNSSRQDKSAASAAAPVVASSRQQEKSEATRLRICEGAARCLCQNGYHRTSIKQIADHAGVSQGALQHHFPAKEELVAAVAQFLLARSLRWFSGATINLTKSKRAFGEVIRRSWREQFTTDEYGALLEIMTAARTDDALRKRVAPELDAWRIAIEEQLRDVVHPNPKSAESFTALLNISLCMMTGLLVHEGLLGDEKRMDMMLNQWIDMTRAHAR